MTSGPKGIKGLEGRVPIGAALTIGIKGPSGAPTKKDRFWLVWPHANDQGIRPRHPGFVRFNDAPAERRKLMLMQLVHGREQECFEHRYRCHKAPGKPAHPKKLPYCVGNGEKARRYMGNEQFRKDNNLGDDEFRDGACAGERCQYRQGSKAPCKPWMRLLARVCWNQDLGMPTPLVKFTSQSWNTIKNFLGFFDHLGAQASELGFDDARLIGFRFAMQLSEMSNPEARTRFPVVSLTPIDDPIEFFSRQIDFRERAGSHRLIETREVPALTDRQLAGQDTSDYLDHVPGNHHDPTQETE
jgi:hypothetical protein